MHPHLEIKIVDRTVGRTLPRGIQGELCTRGYSVMSGYWDEPEKTAEAIDESGWMHTGDLAIMDDDGYLNITGRIKDLIIRGGENISVGERGTAAHPSGNPRGTGDRRAGRQTGRGDHGMGSPASRTS